MNPIYIAVLGVLGVAALAVSPAQGQAVAPAPGAVLLAPEDPMAAPQGQQVTAAEVPGLSWVPAVPGRLPVNAMVAGTYGGRTIHVCRVRNDGVRVGKLMDGTCLIPLSGAEIGFTEYEVLTGAPWLLRWPLGSGLQPGTGFVAGQVGGLPGLLCMVEHMSSVHPGMVIQDRCHFGLNGKEIMAVDYRYADPNPPGQFSMRYASGGWVPPGALTVADGVPQAATLALGPAAICLAQSGAAWIPGMIDPAGGCRYVAGAAVEYAPAYTVVVGDPARAAWVAYEDGALPRWEGPPEYSVRIGGYRPDGPPLEVCRGEVGEQLAAGHVLSGQCLVAAGPTQVLALPRYQVLHYIQGVQQADTQPMMPVMPDAVR